MVVEFSEKKSGITRLRNQTQKMSPEKPMPVQTSEGFLKTLSEIHLSSTFVTRKRVYRRRGNAVNTRGSYENFWEKSVDENSLLYRDRWRLFVLACLLASLLLFGRVMAECLRIFILLFLSSLSRKCELASCEGGVCVFCTWREFQGVAGLVGCGGGHSFAQDFDIFVS